MEKYRPFWNLWNIIQHYNAALKEISAFIYNKNILLNQGVWTYTLFVKERNSNINPWGLEEKQP